MSIQNSSKKLNPFILPSDTDFRFILLIFSVISATLYTYHGFFYSWYLQLNPGVHSRQLQCIQQLGVFPNQAFADIINWQFFNFNLVLDPEALKKAQENLEELNAYSAAADACELEFSQHYFIWSASALVILFTAAYIVYRLYPTWRIWRKKLIPISQHEMPEVLKYLSELTQAIGLEKMPSFFWIPFNGKSSGGFAFGRPSKYCIALPAGLITHTFYKDRTTFRAIVLHELSHIHNKDIGKTYFSLALSNAFLGFCIVPFIFTHINKPVELFFTWGGFTIFLLIAIIYTVRNGILRSREFYADVKAASIDGFSGSLEKALRHDSSLSKNIFARLKRVHPDPKIRCQVINNPDILFRLNFLDCFIAGVILGISYSGFRTFFLFSITLLPNGPSHYSNVLVIVLLTPILVGILGTGMWRICCSHVFTGRAKYSLLNISSSITLGMILGGIFSFDSISNINSYSSAELDKIYETTVLTEVFDILNQNFISALVFHLIWSTLLLICLYVFLKWLFASSREWIQVSNSQESLKRFHMIGFIASSILLALIIGVFMSAYTMQSILFFALTIPFVVMGSDTTFFGKLSSFASLIALISLWLYPLLPTFMRLHSRKIDTIWAFMGKSSSKSLKKIEKLPVLSNASWLAIFKGVSIATGFFIVIWGVPLILNIPLTDALKVKLFLIERPILIITQLAIAFKISQNEEQLFTAKGLFSTVISGFILASTSLLVTLGSKTIRLVFGLASVSDGWQKEFEFYLNSTLIFQYFSDILRMGMFIAIPVVLTVAWSKSRKNRNRAHS